jgi:PAS domain S-box-containing protein
MNAPIRILHLEDEPADARLLREQLRLSDLPCSIAVADSREAFEAQLTAASFDVVLSDFRVPRFSGLEALALVRRHDPRMPFILVTGALVDERAVELLRSGATDFVLKDRLARLAPAIRRALAERDAARLQEQAEARLTDELRLSKLAAEAARMGTWRLDLNAGRLDVSDEFLRLIGVEPAQWSGTAEAFDALVHPDDAQHRRQAEADAIVRGQFMELEFRIRRPDGEVRWVQSRGECYSGSDGRPQRVLGILMDITQRREMEDALREADRRKDQFLATLAHELRNPLAPIYNGLSLLRQANVAPRDRERVHAMLDRQINHVIRLVDDLLDVSRITLGKIELKRERITLQTVVHGAVEMSSPIIESAGHRLKLLLPAEPLLLDGDPVRLTQALSNLLNNAAKHTRARDEITLSARALDGQLVISVRDNGPGIPADMLERVFDMFVQLDRVDGVPMAGLGIGLTMVRMLVTLHGGEVEARSEGTGKGSEFIVRLPLASVPARNSESSRSAQSPSLHCPHRVLIVDDNKDFADSLATLLSLSGADTEVAYDGASALASLALRRPELVLLDVGMPDMDGYTVARRIREDPSCRGVTLVALTGWGQEQDRLRAMAAGFDHHLTKPVDPLHLQRLFNALEPHPQA